MCVFVIYNLMFWYTHCAVISSSSLTSVLMTTVIFTVKTLNIHSAFSRLQYIVSKYSCRPCELILPVHLEFCILWLTNTAPFPHQAPQPLITTVPPSSSGRSTFFYWHWVKSLSIYLSVPGLFHLTERPLGSFMLSQIIEFNSFSHLNTVLLCVHTRTFSSSLHPSMSCFCE
jgi:hypothetical protein